MSRPNRREVLKQFGGTLAGAFLAGRPGQAGAVAADQPRLKIGQIGTGHAHAAGKLKAIQKLSDRYELVGVVENDPRRRRELGGSYLGVKLISEEQLFNIPGLQAVAVETEVRDLVSTAHRCIDAGVHVHLDKPGGESFQDYKNLLEKAGQQGLTVQMGYIYRYHPAIRFCAEALRKGWLGEPFEVDGVISKTVGPAVRRQLAEYRGGTMFELGCHVLDVVIWLLGKPENVTAYVRRTRPEQDDLADNQLAVLEYPQALATVRSALVEVEGPRRRQLVVCGDQGTFDLRPLNQSRFRLALDRPRGSYRRGYQDVELPEKPVRYVGDFVELAAVIRGEKEPDFSPEHDLAVHRAILQGSGYDLK